MGEHVAEAYAVETRLRMRAEPIDAGDVPELGRELLDRPSRKLSTLEPELANWLIRIESKLDCMLATMGLPQDMAPLSVSPLAIELSLDGLVVERDDLALPDAGAGHCKEGSYLKVEMEVPGPPVHPIVCIARVASRSSDPARRLRLHFKVIREEDCDAIVAHTMKVQRRELRLRSGMAG